MKRWPLAASRARAGWLAVLAGAAAVLVANLGAAEPPKESPRDSNEAAEERTRADKPPSAPETDVQAIREAITTAVSLVEKSTPEYRKQRQCFSCHHQAMPALFLAKAREKGFAVDEENYRQQLKHTAAHLERNKAGYSEGRGQGGRGDTAGWALWTLETGKWNPDEVTAATTHYLLEGQFPKDHWSAASRRPPTEGSAFTTTYVALRGLAAFGTLQQQERIEARRDAARQWLIKTEPADTEDRVFRLRALAYLDADDAAADAAKDLAARQREDGGWSQTGELESDAYATATALVAVHEYGHVAVSDDVYRRGVAYLLKTRQPDGSWRVATRAKPIQTYFESGFPHERDQFISIAATSWSGMALLPACPEANKQ